MVAKKLVFPLFLITLIAFKVFSLTIHLKLHHSDKEEHHEPCELCEQAEFVASAQFSDIDGVDIPELQQYSILEHQPSLKENFYITNRFSHYHFCRPPPKLS